MSDLKGQTVVVTGGAGFIGSHVVDRLVSVGARVRVIDDLSVGEESNIADARKRGDVQFEKLDIMDYAGVERVVRGANVVLHLAVQCVRLSLKDPMRVHDVNATGTLHVLRAAEATKVSRFVYVSSSEVYGTAIDEDAPITEKDPLIPTTVYGASKAVGEMYTTAFLTTYGMKTTVVRPFNSYGPRSHANGAYGEVIPRFVARILGGEQPVIFGDGKQTRDFTYVEDTARGIVDTATSEKAIGETINIARGREVTIADVARTVARACGRPEIEPRFDEARPADVRRHLADTTKAEKLLGYTARIELEEGVRRYLAHVKDRGGTVSAEEAGRRNW
jgi:UDP-glucose 4-epimerase